MGSRVSSDKQPVICGRAGRRTRAGSMVADDLAKLTLSTSPADVLADTDQSEAERRWTVDYLRKLWAEFLGRSSNFEADLKHEHVATKVTLKQFQAFSLVYGYHIEIFWQPGPAGYVTYCNPSFMHERTTAAFNSVLLKHLRKWRLDKLLIDTRSATVWDLTGWTPFRDPKRQNKEFVQKDPDTSYAPVKQLASEPPTLGYETHYTNVGKGGLDKDVQNEADWFITRVFTNIYVAIGYEHADDLQARIHKCEDDFHPRTSKTVPSDHKPGSQRNVPPTTLELAEAMARRNSVNIKKEMRRMLKGLDIKVYIQTTEEMLEIYSAKKNSADTLVLPTRLLVPDLPKKGYPKAVKIPVREIYEAIMRDCLASHLFITKK